MLICNVVGARPNFMKIAPIVQQLQRRHIPQLLVHTGQHYDANMSQVFFEELGMPQPDIYLGVGSDTHARQTARIMMAFEEVCEQYKPALVVVSGDVNSTLAAALVAAKLHIPVAHIEAGLRSYDRTMPEEVNRVLTDHISNILFAPTQAAVNNLAREGITDGVRLVGDVRVDVLLGIVGRARERQNRLFGETRLAAGEPFALATIHRASNTDDRERLQAIVEVMSTLEIPVVLPVHPRLRKMMKEFGFQFSGNVRAIDPVGFLDMVALLDACQIVITDSGGLQKEAYMLRRPCVTVRDTTEWVETVESGWNRLCEPTPAEFKAAVAEAQGEPPAAHPDFYGAPGVSERICDALEAELAVKVK